MKLNHSFLAAFFATVLLSLAGERIARASEPIAFDQIGAEAQKQYSGEGVSITPTAGGARLQASFQMLEGEVSAEGLWLTSKTEVEVEERFRVLATAIGRADTPSPEPDQLATQGRVESDADVSRFIRPGLIEEYRVSVDGVRQDFLIASPPAGEGPLSLQLSVEGATAESTGYGAKLTTKASGHEFAYSRLHVTDATGKVLVARMEVPSADHLRVVVEDREAVYPVRVDPVFSQVNWITSNAGITGVNGIVRAVVTAEFSNLIYVAGDFTFAGKTLAGGVARWDGSQWSSVGDLQFNGSVRALTFWNGNLIAGGDFTQYGDQFGGQIVNHVASWSGSNWGSLGAGTNGAVRALLAFDDQINPPVLCVGGDFTLAGGVADTNRIAKWDGSTWSALGTGMDDSVRALASINDAIYAGGSFNSAGGVSSTAYIAKWDGSAWSALGSGVDGAVNALAGYTPNFGTPLLYVGGDFLNAGGSPANYLAKWDDTNWTTVGGATDLNGSVHAIALSNLSSPSNLNVHVGGAFTSVPGVFNARHYAKWQGFSWSGGVLSEFSDDVLALAIQDPNSTNGEIFAGGAFKSLNGNDVNYIVKSGSFSPSWSTLGSGISSTVRAVAVNSLTNEVFVGGDFLFSGNFGGSFRHIARWAGSQWESLNEGVNGPVHALLIQGNALYVGGSFDGAGFGPAHNIAKWESFQWAPLGAGTDGLVQSLAWSGSDLYAGGDFTAAGGTAGINRIAKWDGSAWSALGSGMNGEVSALAASGGDLFAGGDFTTPAQRIAKWNGSAWSALGTGMDQQVRALAVSGSDLFAGGDFTTPGNRIAKWDGSSWSALGIGLNGPVLALAVNYNNVFVGGSFTTAGGLPSNNIAKWNGSAWTAFSNMDGPVRGLAINAQYQIFAVGDFLSTREDPFAPRVPSPYFAEGFLAQPAMTVTPSSAFETITVATTGAQKTFTITNTGGDILLLGTITIDGTNFGEFDFDASGVATTIAPGATTSFTVAFVPTGTNSGTRTAAVHIPYNVTFSPFNVNLSALALSTTDDGDSDGLNDWAEFQFSLLGFNWQVSQPALVNNLFSNLGNAQTNVNDAGFYSLGQVQALNVGTPLLEPNGSGQFKLTIGVEKSTTLQPTSFLPFSLSGPGTTTSFVDGKLEFLFSSPDDAAFFQLRAE